MNFEKEAMFLGYKEMNLRDGTVLSTITFFVDGSALEVNVLASNKPVMSAVQFMSFGDTCTVTFSLRKVDKLYKLSLVSVA